MFFSRWLIRWAAKHIVGRSHQGRRRGAGAASSRPRLEALEGRLVPATHTWSGAHSNFWSDPGNWQEGSAPTQTEGADLIFPATVTNPTSTDDLSSSSSTTTSIHSIRFDGSGYTVNFWATDPTFPPDIQLTPNPSGNSIEATNRDSVVNTLDIDLRFPVQATHPYNFAVNNPNAVLVLSGTMDGGLAGTPGVPTKLGPGTLIFSGRDLGTGRVGYKGETDIDEGVLDIEKPGALGCHCSTADGTVVVVGAALRLGGGDRGFSDETLTIAPGASAGLPDGELQNEGGSHHWTGDIILKTTATIGVRSGDLTIDGSITDAAILDPTLQTHAPGITKVDGGTLTLKGIGQFFGPVTVSGGILQVAADNALVGHAVTVAGGASFGLNGHDITIDSLAGTGAVTLGPNTLTVRGDNTSTTLGGGIGGDGGLTKTGSGTQTLSGNNTYSGPTTVSAGTLLVDGSLANSSITVTNATLGGKNPGGSVGPITVLDGGILSPGDPQNAGKLNSAGPVTLTSHSTFTAQLAPGDNGDNGQLSAGGPVDLGGSTLNLAIAPGFTPPLDGTTRYTIISATGGIQHQFGNGPFVHVNDMTFKILYSSTDVKVIRVKDPLTWIGGGLTANWSDSGNWLNGKMPAGGDSVEFPALVPGTGVPVGHLTNTNDLGVPLDSILFSGPGYSISGQAISLTGGIQVESSVTTGGDSLNLPLTLTAPQTFTTGAAGTQLGLGDVNTGGFGLTVDGAGDAIVGTLSGGGTLTKAITSTGRLTFGGNAANTLGDATVDAGVLELDKPANVTAIPGNLVIGQGVTPAAVVVDGDGQIAASATVTLAAGTSLDLGDGAIGVAVTQAIGSLNMTGGEVADLSGTGRSTLVLNSNLTATADASGNPANISTNLSLGGTTRTLSVNNAGGLLDLVVSGAIIGAGLAGLTKAGSGVALFSGTTANTYAGPTTVGQGVLELGKTAGVTAITGALVIGTGTSSTVAQLLADNQIADAAAVTVGPNGILDLHGHSDTFGSLSVTGGAVSTSGGSLTLNGIAGTALTMTGGNVSTALGQFTAGTLTLDGDVTAEARSSSSGAVPAVIDGTVLLANGPRTFNVSAVTGSSADGLDVTATILGDAGAGLIKVGAGTMRLTAGNPYTGATTVNGGNLVLSDGGTAANTPSFTVNFGAALVLDNNAGINNSAGTNRTDRVGSGATVALDGGTFNFVGLAGASSRQAVGPLTLTGGACLVGSTTGTAAGSAAVLQFLGLNRDPGAVVDFVGFGVPLGTGANQVLFRTPPPLDNGILPYAEQSSTSPTYALTGFATYGANGIGPFTNYVTSLAAAGPTDNVKLLPGPSGLQETLSANKVINSLTVQGGFTVAENGHTLTIGDGTYGGMFTIGTVGQTAAINGGTLAFNNAEGIFFPNEITPVSSLITGSGGLTTFGPHLIGGGLSFSGNNNYTGPTTIDGGVLLVNDAQPTSPVVVNPGGSLNGPGIVGAITANGGVVAASVERFLGHFPLPPTPTILTAGGDVSFTPASTFAVVLAGAAAGSGYSQLNVTGSGSTIDLGGAILSSGLSFAPTPGESFTIIHNGGTSPVTGTFRLVDPLSGTASNLPEGAAFKVSSKRFHITYRGGTGNDVVLTANRAPNAADDSYGVDENGSLSVPAPGVLANDSDPDGDRLATILVAGPAHAAEFTLHADGSFIYRPAVGYFGSDTFTYQAFDGELTSNMATVGITVRPTTTTTVTSSVNPSVFGQPVIFTATVSTVNPGAGTPTGTMAFFIDSSTPVITEPVDSSGQATLSVSTLAPGSHSIDAEFDGAGQFANSGGILTASQQVFKARTTTTVTPSSTDPLAGQPVTLTATVSATSPGAGAPTGTVIFSLDVGPELGRAPLSSLGPNGPSQASFVVPGFTADDQDIRANYGGDDNFQLSVAHVRITVHPIPTTTVGTSSANPSVVGQPVTFTATVTPAISGAGTPTGVVTFRDGATVLGTGSLDASGRTTFATPSLKVGWHAITAAYGGDRIFQGSSSQGSASPLTQTVNPAVTTTVVTSSASPSPAGQAVTFTATVTVKAPGAGMPTGDVHFLDLSTGVVLGTAPLASGSASVTASALGGGIHVIQATYFGGTDFNVSFGSFPQTITPIDVTALTSFTHNGGSFNHRTNQYVQTATLTNTGGSAIQGPVSLVFDLPSTVLLYGAVINGSFVAAKKTRDGRYYIDLLDAGSLFAPGQTITMSLEFSAYPGAYVTHVWAGPGQR